VFSEHYIPFVCSQNKQRLPLMQHSRFGFYNRDGESLQRGTDWVLMWHRYDSSLKG